MKKSLYGMVFWLSIILTACAQTRNIQEPYQDAYYDQPSNSISYQQFYDDLSPYGQWINNPEFGYVWVPRLSGFRPYYSNGSWAYTNYGWTWVSNYNWGWAPFHYGNWFYDDFYGWSWVPGYEWAPAWVNWRSNSQYYGWAPQCPRGRNGRYYEVRNDQWAFVPHQYINRRNINNYYVSPQNNTTIINNTTEIRKVRVINRNTQYEEGPSVAEVEKVTNTRIRPLAVKQSSVPGSTKLQNGELRIFKPAVKENNVVTEKSESIRPAKVIEKRNVPATVQPMNEAPQTNNKKIISPDKAISPDNRVTIKPAEDINDRPSVPVGRKIRQVPTEQQQPLENRAQQAPRENRIKQVPEENTTNINPPVERRPIAPQQNPGRINQRERVINNQQQNPSFNQRPVRENRVPDFNRSSNVLERRPQTVPNNSIPVQRKFDRQR